MQRESQQAAQRFETERAELAAQLEAAKQQLAAAESAAEGGSGSPGPAGPMREASAQTDDEGRALSAGSAGHGRRAAAPSRQGTCADQMAAASPLHQRASQDGPANLMLHTDNLGQVTPLSSFSPGGAQDAQGRPSCLDAAVQRSSPLTNGLQRVGSAGRSGRRGTRMSEGHTAEDALAEGAEG